MKIKVFFYLVIFLTMAACGHNKRPGLSDKELFVLKAPDTLRQETVELNEETYVPPPGIKYNESRAIDPANPPVVLDIANRKLNIKKFDLSDYYTKVRYIKLKHPMPPKEGNFLFDANYYVTYERGAMSASGQNSKFQFSDDYIIAGDNYFGLHCYDKEGNFLYTIESNDFPKTYNISQNLITYSMSDFKGFIGGISTIKNSCLYNFRENNKNFLCLYDLDRRERLFTRNCESSVFFLNDNSIASYTYWPLNPNRIFLFTFNIKGDTLCRFQSYNFVPEMKKNSYVSPPSPNIYYYNGQLTVNQSLNDTVFRVVSPNRLVPVYILNFGSYKLDVQTALYGDQSQKLRTYTWEESNRYILFIYTQNYDCQNNRNNGSVKFFYSFYDKKSRQLYHFSEGTTMPEDHFFIENPIPDALPFILSSVEIEENQLRVCYSKRRLEDIIKNKGFASLSPEQQEKVKTLQSELDESEVLIMILE